MASCCQNNVEIKLFAGIPIKADLKLQLQQSPSWKQSEILRSEERDVIEIQYHGKEYIGCFIQEKKPTLADVEDVEKRVKSCLAKYCPDYAQHEISVHIFPQVFVS